MSSIEEKKTHTLGSRIFLIAALLQIFFGMIWLPTHTPFTSTSYYLLASVCLCFGIGFLCLKNLFPQQIFAAIPSILSGTLFLLKAIFNLWFWEVF